MNTFLKGVVFLTGALLSAASPAFGDLISTATATPLPVARSGIENDSAVLEILPAPSWIHPASGETFLFGGFIESDFLDWTDVLGAGAYVYDLTVIPKVGPTIKVPLRQVPFSLNEMTPTPLPEATPRSHSQVHFNDLRTSVGNFDSGYVIKIAALDRSPTPQVGEWSESIEVRMIPKPTESPSPTIPPTPNVDLDDSSVVDASDVFVFQNSWDRQSDDIAYYNPRADLDRSDRVDEKDLLLLMEEMDRQTLPFPAPELVYPPDRYETTFQALIATGVLFDWRPLSDFLLSEEYGGIAYHIAIRGPYQNPDDDPLRVVAGAEIETFGPADPVRGTEQALTPPFEIHDGAWYQWRVWAVSPEGIKKDGLPAIRYFRVFNVPGKSGD